MTANWIKAIIPATLLAVSASFGAPSPAVKAPVGLSAAVTSGRTVILTWCADETPASFTIQRLGFPDGLANYTVAGNRRLFIQSELTKGRTYHYRIKAEMPMRSSQYSSVVEVTVP